tara:strand:- start:227 stop:502 length:276 start_codon:yes stop_codon:yes gene_type:complete
VAGKFKSTMTTPGTRSYRGFSIYKNQYGGANYLITPPGESDPSDGANTLGDSKSIIDIYIGQDLGKAKGGVVKKQKSIMLKGRGGRFKGVK